MNYPTACATEKLRPLQEQLQRQSALVASLHVDLDALARHLEPLRSIPPTTPAGKLDQGPRPEPTHLASRVSETNDGLERASKRISELRAELDI